MLRNYFAILMLCILLAGCFEANTGAILKDNYGYIRLSGNTSEISLVIDTGEPIEIDKNTPPTNYKVKSGEHTLKIYSHKNQVQTKKIYVTANQIVEVVVE